MTKLQVHISESDVTKLILEFLESRKLHIAQLSVERETGVINGDYSEDTLFLRQLILDGQWDSALDFVEPLISQQGFDNRQFRYLVLKYKYYELLCIKTEPGPMQNNEFTVDEVVECLQSLESLCPTPDDYRHLCALLTLPNLQEHDQFQHWNPSSARVECFVAVYPLVAKFLPPTDASKKSAKHDRLLQLLTKGLLYEACVDFCQNKALLGDTGKEQKKIQAVDGQRLLIDVDNGESADVSLIGWLESLPKDSFRVQFVQRVLDMKCDAVSRPQLQAQWTEQILMTPIKPLMFPHLAVPVGRLKSAEMMSRSMIPQFDGLAYGLGHAVASSSSHLTNHASNRNSLLSQSIAVGFQLTGKPSQLMQQSAIDVLLDTSSQTRNSAGSAVGNANGSADIQHSLLSLQQQQQQQQQQSMFQSTLEVIEESSPLGLSQTRLPIDTSSYDNGPPTPRQQIEEMRRRSAPPISQSIHIDNAKNAIDTEKQRYSGGGKLYQEFSNKQRSVRFGPEMTPNTTVFNPEALAYQVMQMSLYSGQQQRPPVQMYQPAQRANPLWDPTVLNGRHLQHPDDALLDQNAFLAAGQMPLLQRKSSLHSGRNESSSSDDGFGGMRSTNNNVTKPVQFVAVNRLEDPQAIRAVSFHPSGRYFAVGTNSRQLHICRYPEVKVLRHDHTTKPPDTVLLRPKQHRGSVYCVGFNPTGELLATGSNDKAIRLMKFDTESCKIGPEFELTMHDGTVRDLVFVEDTTSRTSLLISGGAGNCRIYLTDCSTGSTLRQLQGHTAPVLGLYTWGGCVFVSCSQDKTIRFWDLRCPEAVNVITPTKSTTSSPVTSVCVDPSGRLLASGHEDASVMLYDIQSSRMVQSFRPHVDEVRAVRFSPGTYYLLTGSYDKKIVITDIRGNLFEPLKYLPVAEHEDKVIQCRWHPHDFTFLSTSADRSVILWALPPPETA